MSLLQTLSFSQGRVTTQPLRVVALSMYASVLIVDVIYRSFGWCHGELNNSTLWIIGGILIVLTGIEWAEQRYFVGKPALWLAIALLATRIVLTEVTAIFECSGFHEFFFLIPPMLAYLYIGRRAAYITAAVCTFLNLSWLIPPLPPEKLVIIDNLFIETFIFLVGMLFVLVMGRVLELEERNREKAEQLVAELEQSQQQIAELAKVEERNRIARDIHDSVGHHLTAVNIQLEKAIAFRPIDAAEADQALLDAKRAARSALTDVRESVSTLRTPDAQFELSAALQQLVNHFEHVPTTLTVDGDESAFTKPALMALYRAAQEGLTNIDKHAQATAAKLTVALQTDRATLTLSDNGIGIDQQTLDNRSTRRDAHFGLAGLRERLELLGGTLSIEKQRPHGTRLHVSVPAKGLT